MSIYTTHLANDKGMFLILRAILLHPNVSHWSNASKTEYTRPLVTNMCTNIHN